MCARLSRSYRLPSEATPDKRDIVFDFISHNPRVIGSKPDRLRSKKAGFELFVPIRISVWVQRRETRGRVSRSTMYYWMEHRWIHRRELPSGRGLICEASLSRRMRDQPEIPLEFTKSSPKVSENVRNRPIRLS